LLNRQKHAHEIQNLAESFIKGQGSIYVLGACNKTKTSNGIVDNGPEYTERVWNSRKLNQSDVNSLVQTTAGGNMMYPKVQEHAIIIAASRLLIKDIALSKYQSHDFPPIVFNGKVAGNVYIVNGHHRIAAWKQLHADLLVQLQEYQNILKGNGACTESDPVAVEAAHHHVESLEKQLYAEGGWGAIVLDYGMFLSNIHQFDE
jgi:hypothetical protein